MENKAKLQLGNRIIMMNIIYIGISDTKTRVMVRHNILYPDKPASLLKTRNEDNEDTFYIFMGVTTGCLVLIVIIFLVCILRYKRR